MNNRKTTYDVLREMNEGHFRVAIFGSSRTKPDTEIYKQVYELAEQLGGHGIDLITGGGPGIMEAASAGHNKGDKTGRAHSIGVTVQLPFKENANKYIDIEQHYQRFSERLDQFMVLSNVVVIVPGGIGTCLELFYSWQLTQVGHVAPMPIIVVGQQWRELVEWARKWLLGNKLVDEKDFNNVFVVDNPLEATKIIMNTYKIYEKEGPEYVLDFNKVNLNK